MLEIMQLHNSNLSKNGKTLYKNVELKPLTQTLPGLKLLLLSA